MSAMEEVQKRAEELVQKDGKLSQSDVISLVFKADPDLYRQYRAEVPGTRMVTSYPGRGGEVTKVARGTVDGPTVRQQVSGYVMEQARALAINEKIPLSEAIDRIMQTEDGRALYGVLRDPRSADAPMPVQASPKKREALTKLDAIRKLDVLRRAERFLAHAISTERYPEGFGEVLRDARIAALEIDSPLAKRLIKALA